MGALDVGVPILQTGVDIWNSIEDRNAAEYANKQNIDLAREQWYSQILTNQIARGAPYTWDQSVIPGATSFKNGTPVFMPYYTGEDELGLYGNAKGVYDTTMKNWGGPEGLIKKNTDAAEQFRGMMSQGKGIAGDLFSGQRTNQRLAELAPVAGARLNSAAAQRQAINTNLQQRLNALEAQQANKGFVGGSTFDRSAMYRSALPDYQTAAAIMADAKLQNELAGQQIRNEDWNMAFQNLNLPAQMAQQYVAFENLPTSQAVASYNDLMGVYSPFMLKEWNPPTRSNMPEVKPVGSTLGAVTSTASDFLSDYTNYANQQKTMDWIAQQAELERQARANQYSWMNPSTNSSTSNAVSTPNWWDYNGYTY